ncbi:hypothetical protein D0864_05279 [Hortaea werneckii]|uniref:O-methyltransferase C-terminal domain-containing protein n=1 Tax=Hortaea werneckii TaxID=91943 RepID=A0A3M7G3N0_HORWE|nr:hypothetical protein D0864_05279 [Hortaea werneckii]
MQNGHSNGASHGPNGTQVGRGAGDYAEVSMSVPVSTALSSCNPAIVPTCAKDIARLGETFSSTDNATRKELLRRSRELVLALETPRETMIRHCWAEPAAYMAITFGVNQGLFDTMVANGDRPSQVSELAASLDVESSLLARIMRHLAAMGYISETDFGEYRLTNLSKSFTIPIIKDGYPCLAGGARTALDKFPEYAAKTGCREPDSVDQGPYQYAFDTPLNFFAYLQANNPLGTQFNNHMGGYRQGRPSWMDTDFFPVRERLVKGARDDPDAVFLVDVGGNVGHDLAEFRQKHGTAVGRVVLQDLPPVLGQIEALDASIERMPHDFFTEQPVKGARAYYMHSVLHDWPDETCVSILSSLRGAMMRGYSKLLINENVIPDTGAHWEATALDMMMLTLLAAKERTATQWRHLIEEMAGLKIVKIWDVGAGVESLIECELP